MKLVLLLVPFGLILQGGILEKFEKEKKPNPLGYYEFISNTDRYVSLEGMNSYCIGKLDLAGNFIPHKWFVNIRGDTSGPGYHVLNYGSRKGKEFVYEYRSARLIEGHMDKGNFIPEVGTKVIDFQVYRYSEEAPRIYNLPGRFVKKGSKDDKKK